MPIVRVGVQGFPLLSPAIAPAVDVGAYTFNFPYWCRVIEYILLGGGAGGRGGWTNYWSGGIGAGGGAGVWVTGALVRGVDIPWSTRQITGIIGSGGWSGGTNSGAGGPGGATTAAAVGWAGASAAGGNPDAGAGINGAGPGDKTYNGILYPGGAGGGAGIPGGGGGVGAGGGGGSWQTWGAGAGGAGGRGQAWFRTF